MITITIHGPKTKEREHIAHQVYQSMLILGKVVRRFKEGVDHSGTVPEGVHIVMLETSPDPVSEEIPGESI